MKGRHTSLVFIPLLVSLALVAVASPPLPLVMRILRRDSGKVESIPLEEYVASVLPVEMGPAPQAALEAQAIAARSYAMARAQRHDEEDADLCDRTHCQVYHGLAGATAASLRATRATEGLVLVQDGHVIAAPFHAACGGRTARPGDVWDDEQTPDLTSVDDDACAKGASWTFRLARSDVPELGKAMGFGEARFLEVFGHDGDGRVSMLRLAAAGGRSRIVSGFAFRQAASRLWGVHSVRSTAFEMTENHSDYVLVGRGYGHGAGLCQRGAIIRAQRGESRAEILALYYKGARVQSLVSLAAR